MSETEYPEGLGLGSDSDDWLRTRSSTDHHRPTADRYLPYRDLTGIPLSAQFDTLPTSPVKEKKPTTGDLEASEHHKEESNKLFRQVLGIELFGRAIEAEEDDQNSQSPIDIERPSQSSQPRSTFQPSSPPKKLFVHSSPSKSRSTLSDTPSRDAYSLSPLRSESQSALTSPTKPARTIPKAPFKVLDAPDLKDDFYLNLVDWSSQNVLAVGLGKSVYLWNARTCQVSNLCDSSDSNPVTSVSWAGRGAHLAIGTQQGTVQIWDVNKGIMISSLGGRSGRVSSLSWTGPLLASGSRDRTIMIHDMRSPSTFEKRLDGHKQEVCGLKWNPSGTQLASGGNDNKLFVWDASTFRRLHEFKDHTAAVKAIAWSPHQSGLLASGGGTADKRICFRNTNTGITETSIDTGSQVCNLAWSTSSNEIVSTHGYSQNQIVVWKYPTMTPLATLTGHTFRVLYLALSPDGEVIVTGAGDETLRFWNVFSKNSTPKQSSTILDPFSQVR